MSTERPRRIGLTMRTDSPAEYPEPRDGLARDWGEFLAFAAPGARWIPVPNLGEEAVGYAEELGLDALVLTGGADLGADALRDRTELALLAHAAALRLPVFGVCRGLQVILRFHGVERLEHVPEAEHLAAWHPVRLADGSVERVNSYHRNGVRAGCLPAACRPTAVTPDGWVEGVRSAEHRMSGVMWHPERGRPFRELDRRIFRNALDLSELPMQSTHGDRGTFGGRPHE